MVKKKSQKSISDSDPDEVLGDNSPNARYNFRTGVTAGVFAAVARDFFHPQLILAGLVYAITKSPVLVALVTIINKAFTMGPQLLVSSFLEHSPRRRPQFIILTFARSSAYFLLVVGVWLMTNHESNLTITLFFVIYSFACLSNAFGHVIYMDMIGRLIPSKWTGSYIGTRNFLGGIAAIATGFFIIQPILGNLQLPWNYLLISFLGAVFVAVDMSIWCQCREKPGVKADEKSRFRDSMRRGLEWLKKDHNYRCYLLQRIGFRISFVGLAFFIPYGSEELGYESEVGGIALLGGIMVAVLKLSRTCGGLFWGKIADAFGSRISLVFGGLFFVLAPLTALLAPRLPHLFEIQLSGGVMDLPLTVYLLALAMMGLAIQATMVAGQRFLIVSAPLHRRASYIGFLNTLTSPLTLLPLLGAFIASEWGMQALFALVACGGLISLAGALAMKPYPPQQGVPVNGVDE